MYIHTLYKIYVWTVRKQLSVVIYTNFDTNYCPDKAAEKRSSSEHEAELASMREEYEKKIATLQSQFGQEQANRARLEEELQKVKDNYENMVEETKVSRP